MPFMRYQFHSEHHMCDSASLMLLLPLPVVWNLGCVCPQTGRVARVSQEPQGLCSTSGGCVWRMCTREFPAVAAATAVVRREAERALPVRFSSK